MNRYIVTLMSVLALLAACGPETPEPVPGSNNDRTGPSSVLEFSAEPYLNTEFGPTPPSSWHPFGCVWGQGISMLAETPDVGSVYGIKIDRAGCSVESSLAAVPPEAVQYNASLRTDLRGHACSLGDCDAMVIRWFDSNKRMLAVSEYDVGPFAIEVPYNFAETGSIPPGARYVSVTLHVPRDLREAAAAFFTRLSFDFQ